MKNISPFLLALIFLVSCGKDNRDLNNKKEEKFVIDKIYDYNNQLVAEYFYNNDNKLIRRSGTNSTTGNYTEYLFEYDEGKVKNIIFKDQNFPQFNHNIQLYYDEKGRIIKDETYQNNSILNTKFYTYNSAGKISNIKSRDGSVLNFVEFSDRLNAVKVTSYLTDPRTSEKTEQYRIFEYDTQKKPSCGIDDIFQIELLPQFGTEAIFEKAISGNNMTHYEGSGTKWIYTYNKNGLPETIETKWKDIATLEPILLRITYKQIE